MNITLRQLAVYDAVARHGSVTGAAGELHLTQSATSMALKSLEHALGINLFVRGGRLVISDQGRAMQHLARNTLIAAEQFERAAGMSPSPETVRIGASPTVAEYILGDLLSDFTLANPNVRLSLHTLPSYDVIQRVDDMAIDVGLVEFVSVRPSLEVRRWQRGAFEVFCCPHHPLAGRPKVAVQDMDGESWCLQHRFADSRRQFTLAMLTQIQTMSVVLESDSMNVIKAAVEAGVGLGCLPREVIANEVRAGRLAVLSVPELDLPMPFTIMTRKDLVKTEALEDLLNRALQKTPS